MSDNSSSLYINNLNAKLVEFDNLYNLSVDEFNTKNYYDNYTIKSTLFNNFSERFLFYYLKNIFKKYESNNILNKIKELFIKSKNNNIDDDNGNSAMSTLSPSGTQTQSPSGTPAQRRRLGVLASPEVLASPGVLASPKSPGVKTQNLPTPGTKPQAERQAVQQTLTIGKQHFLNPPTSPGVLASPVTGTQSLEVLASPVTGTQSPGSKRSRQSSRSNEEDITESIEYIENIISLLDTNYNTFRINVNNINNKINFVKLIELIIDNIKIEKEKEEDIKKLDFFLDFDLDILEIIKKKLSNSENKEKNVSDFSNFKGGVISKKKIIGGENYNIPDEDFFKKNKIELKCNNILEFFLICDIIHDIHSMRGKQDSNCRWSRKYV